MKNEFEETNSTLETNNPNPLNLQSKLRWRNDYIVVWRGNLKRNQSEIDLTSCESH